MNYNRTLIETYRLKDFESGPGKAEKNFYYSALEADNGYLEISFDDIVPDVFNVFEESSEDASLPKSAILFDQTNVPVKYELKQNYPNPFNPVTHISFGLPNDGDVSLKVYNTQGQVVSELLNGYKQAGSYEVVFNAAGLASGLYFYHLQAAAFSQVRRMLLVK